MKRSTTTEGKSPWWCCGPAVKICRRMQRKREDAAWKRDLRRERL